MLIAFSTSSKVYQQQNDTFRCGWYLQCYLCVCVCVRQVRDCYYFYWHQTGTGVGSPLNQTHWCPGSSAHTKRRPASTETLGESGCGGPSTQVVWVWIFGRMRKSLLGVQFQKDHHLPAVDHPFVSCMQERKIWKFSWNFAQTPWTILSHLHTSQPKTHSISQLFFFFFHLCTLHIIYCVGKLGGEWGKQVGIINEESQVGDCYNFYWLQPGNSVGSPLNQTHWCPGSSSN